MKKTLLKDTLRSISANMLRFISIVVIVALGVSFFIGIKSSSPAMGYSANEYFRINNLLDLRVTSRIPFTQEDIEKIEQISKVDYVVRSKYIDAVVNVGDSTLVNSNGTELSCRISSLNVDDAKRFTQTGEADDMYVNRVVLRDGRYPEKPGECLLDAVAAEKYEGLGIGSVIRLSAETSDVRDTLKTQEFTVVGTVDSPMYISDARGTTQVGSGSLSSFVYVSEDEFATDEINELFIKINYDDIYDKFSAEYEDIVNGIAAQIKIISSTAINSKLADLKVEYNAKIFDKQNEIDAYEQESALKLQEKQNEIDEFKAYVDSEDEILEQKKEQNETNKTNLKTTLDTRTNNLNTLQASYDSNVKEFESQSSKIESYKEYKEMYDNLAEKLAEDAIKLNELETEKVAAESDLETKKQNYNDIEERIVANEGKVTTLYEEITDLETENNNLKREKNNLLNTTIPDLDEKIANLENKAEPTLTESYQLEKYKKQKKEAEERVVEIDGIIESNENKIKTKNENLISIGEDIEDDKAALVNAQTEKDAAQRIYDSAKKTYDDALKAYNEDAEDLDEYKALMDAQISGQTELLELQATIEKQEKELATLKISVTEAQINYSLEVRNGNLEIQKAQYDLDNAKSRYYTIDGELTELENEIEQEKQTLNADLRNLKNTLKNIDSISWQTTTQPQLVGHTAFEKTMDNILSMSNIFPIIFFITAMIACFVIMMKNIEEGRGAIGLLKAFGYSNFTITGKYMLYSLFAWLCGAFVGGLLGTCVIPSAVYSIFDIVYTVPNVGARFDLKYILIGLGVSLATTMLATFLALLRELKMYPAALMRPRMVGYNRRSLLERMPDFWGRLPYGIVLLIRTVIRSRKRVAVGSVAIACCTALILSALGLFNSVSDVSSAQYGDEGIFNYDVQFVLNAHQDVDESPVLESIKADESVTSAMLISNVSMTVSADEKKTVSDSVHVIVPSETDNLSDYVNLDVVEGSAVLTSGGTVLSQKLAENMGVSVGDTVYFTGADEMMHSLKVVGVVKNYVDHYAYVAEKTYEETFFEAPQYKYVICTLKDYLTEDEISTFAAGYLKTEDVAGAVTAQMMSKSTDSAINQVRVLVVIFVLSACLLAMIVMYTTSNVNIGERTHEIANIKVIGFSDGEVLLYVIRENLVSTFIGTLIGIVGGVFLHGVLVNLISVENVMYGNNIAWWSFVVAALIIWAVAALAALPILFKINKVRMAETLKSVE